MNDVITKITTSPRLICNNINQNIKVKHEIEKSLENCDSFDFSIAFIADSGISAIQQTLLDVIGKKKKGRIVTSTYLGFNTPKTFRFLKRLFNDSNIEIRIYQKDGFQSH